MARLVLFDVDSTLIDSGGAGSGALASALEELTGIKDGFRGIGFAGKTDLLIIREALDKLGLVCVDGWVDRFVQTYLSHLDKAVQSCTGHVKPGVEALLDALAAEPDIHLGLLTGNMQQGARIKLGRFSLNHFFVVGAYGDDREDRNLLLPVAAGRLFDRVGVCVPCSHCIVVGDTPRDVDCAKAHDARCIAVATGFCTIERLRETNADLVLPDLTQTQRIVRWIKGHAWA